MRDVVTSGGRKGIAYSDDALLDGNHAHLQSFYKHLDRGYGDPNSIDERVLDNLYGLATNTASSTDFVTTYGGQDGIINSPKELGKALAFIEEVAGKDVFKYAGTFNTPVTPPSVDDRVLPADLSTSIDLLTVVTPIPQDIKTQYGLTDWHQKYVNVGGVPIFAEAGVDDQVLLDAAQAVSLIFYGRDDVKDKLLTNVDDFKIIYENRDYPTKGTSPEGRGNGGAFYTGTNIVLPAQSATAVGITHELLHAIHNVLIKDSTYKSDLETVYKTTGSKQSYGHYITDVVQAYWGVNGQLKYDDLLPQEKEFVEKYFNPKPIRLGESFPK
jgi:hypothetical protein